MPDNIEDRLVVASIALLPLDFVFSFPITALLACIRSLTKLWMPLILH